MRLGIDFGTTRTVVARSDRGNYPLVTFDDGHGQAMEWFPSVVAERGGRLVFGFEALHAAAQGATLVPSFKRLLSQPGVTPASVVAVGARQWPLGEVLTGFLMALRDALGKDAHGAQVTVATPANALGPQRFLTLDAFRAAGFEVLGLLNEPSAAGFEYTHRFRQTLSSTRENVLVFDLGGGTFDASLMRLKAGTHEVLATGGDAALGGDDFDAALFHLVEAKLGAVPSAVREAVRLACREAKERVGPNTRRVTVELDGLGLDVEELSLPVADFFDACTPLVERALTTLERVLAQAQVSDEELAGVYVVGGASALPLVGRLLKERFGRRVHRSPYPSGAIAIGLALAADETGWELSDQLSRHFGVFRERDGGRDVAFDSIFAREERVPSAKEGPRAVRRVYRAAHNVGHYRFVETAQLDERGLPHARLSTYGDVTFAFDAKLRGPDQKLDGVPVQRLAGQGPLVEERYAITPQGLVEVSLTDLDTGYARTFTLGR